MDVAGELTYCVVYSFAAQVREATLAFLQVLMELVCSLFILKLHLHLTSRIYNRQSFWNTVKELQNLAIIAVVETPITHT